MLKISLALRDTDGWHRAGELARTTYAETHAADVKPDPDAFVLAVPSERDPVPGGTVLACAGCTYAAPDRPFFSERYLGTRIEEAIAARTGTPVDRDRIIEIGALAGPGGAGRELIRVIPIIAWTMGMEHILCTVTRQLRDLLARLDINYTVLGEADPDHLTPEERAAWGTYYDQRPTVGFIDLARLAGLFAGATGRYAFFAPVVELLTDATTPREVVGRAGR
ncbi:thermostable hemolysin [Streptomyces sp. NPDC057242]|uniref:thermostable hemolysin n=1 Tax=unclassified Streptomyces TaxID=2593676 RepID=UPI003640D886